MPSNPLILSELKENWIVCLVISKHFDQYLCCFVILIKCPSILRKLFFWKANCEKIDNAELYSVILPEYLWWYMKTLKCALGICLLCLIL
jgi:hypothetical protein